MRQCSLTTTAASVQLGRQDGCLRRRRREGVCCLVACSVRCGVEWLVMGVNDRNAVSTLEQIIKITWLPRADDGKGSEEKDVLLGKKNQQPWSVLWLVGLVGKDAVDVIQV